MKSTLLNKNYTCMLLSICFFILTVIGCTWDDIRAKEETTCKWTTSRGVNSGTHLTKNDIQDLKKYGANLLRLSLSQLPLMQLEPPYSINSDALAYIDNVLLWCEEADIKVIIDPHRYPGCQHPWTMLGSDPFWKDFKYHDLVITIWDTISKRYASKGDVIAAYDLLNEPEVKPVMDKGTPNDINLLYKKLIETIRKNDTVHTISLALPRYYKDNFMYKYHKGITLMDIPDDNNFIFQTHTYMPMAFSHQNLSEEGNLVTYPSEIDGKFWNYETLVEEQKELIAFSKEHPEIPILVGEFSAPRWTGENGVRYIQDIIRIAEENNWSWAYHAYRESHIWDPELSQTDRNNHSPQPNNMRIQILKEAFAKNTYKSFKN